MCSFLFLFHNFGTASEVKFEKKRIKIGTATLTVEIADTPERLNRGLMDRQKMGEDEGMLFIFSEEDIRHFWMKNTYIPLSIGFFSKDKKLVDVQDMDAVRSAVEIPKNYSSKKPAKYALEVNQGWFSRHKIRPKYAFEFVEHTQSK
ncbi:MAG: hypothetical protein A4S09_14700 [Proteobacteria bacterium SG_bin7]|nr:MAG: hypothetical protein A4S09_14700 [Proteobacteria bacterium SG_bin7]